jgi:5-amino-6-(5-phosphoribosylamino)uracil reductase
MSVFVIVKSAISLDGFMDDTSHDRRVFSNQQDFERVDDVRASCDAILVGAETIRNDNPRLLVRSQQRRAEREARGELPDPMKATITTSGRFSHDAAFFFAGESPKLVYVPSSRHAPIEASIQRHATVVAAGRESVDPVLVLRDLGKRRVKRLLIEGGGKVLDLFFSAGLVDEVQLSVAPVVLGSAGRARFSWGTPKPPSNAWHLREVGRVGDLVTITYRRIT